MDENKLPGGERPAGEIPAPDLPGTCPHCGAKLAWGALYCKACGEARPETGWHAPVPPIRETASSPRWGFGVAASPREIAAALAMYVLAWWYLWDSQLSIRSIPEIYGGRRSLWPLVFVLGFVGLTELLHWERKRSRESWIWLGCMALITLGIVLANVLLAFLIPSTTPWASSLAGTRSGTDISSPCSCTWPPCGGCSAAAGGWRRGGAAICCPWTPCTASCSSPSSTFIFASACWSMLWQSPCAAAAGSGA